MRFLVVLANGPPGGGSRSERWTNLGPELVRRGHSVVLVRSDLPPGYPAIDPELEARLLDGGVTSYSLGSSRLSQWRYSENPNSLFSRCRRGVAELIWPDCWTTFAVKAMRWLEERAEDFDCVVTPVQPFSGLFVGYYAATRHGLPWIADYGDPWSLQFTNGKWARTREARVETLLLAHSAALVLTTNETAELFARERLAHEHAAHVIPAGVHWQPSGVPRSAPPLVIIQTGTVYGPRLPLHPFLDAIRAYREVHGSNSLRLVWYGDVSRTEELAALRQVANEYRTRATIAEIATAEAVAHAHIVLGNHGGVQIPAKIWRILGTNRIPLLITETSKDPLRSLPELNPISVFAFNESGSILEALEQVRSRTTRHPWSAERSPSQLPDWEARASQFERITQIRPTTIDSSRLRAPAATALLLQGTILGLGGIRLRRLLASRMKRRS